MDGSGMDPWAELESLRQGKAELEERVQVAETPWSGAEWDVALGFDNPRATALVLLLSGTPLRVFGFQTP